MMTGNELVLCHCGSGHRRGWWKPHCAKCWNGCTDNSHMHIAIELLKRSRTYVVLYSDRELDFLKSMTRLNRLPTEKQQHWLDAIVYRATNTKDPGIHAGSIRHKAMGNMA